MIAVPVGIEVPQQVRLVLDEILRRAPDATVLPFFINWRNQLVGIGTSSPFMGLTVSTNAAFNNQVYFFAGVDFQQNIAVSGDAMVSKNLAAGSIITPSAIIYKLSLPGLPLYIDPTGLKVGIGTVKPIYPFHVDTTAWFDKDVTFRGNIIGQKSLGVSGDAMVSKNLVAGSLIVAGQTNINRLLFIRNNGTISIGTAKTFSGSNIYVEGPTAVTGDLTALNNVVIQQNLNVSGDAMVSKNLRAGGVTAAGDVTVGKNFGVNGNAAGFWHTVASASPSAASSNVFSGLSSTALYRMHFWLRWNTSNGEPQVQFNGDAGANYKWEGWSVNSAAASSASGSASDTKIDINSIGSAAASGLVGWFDFSADPSAAGTVFLNGSMTFFESGGASVDTRMFGGRYVGASALTSIKFLASAGTYTGSIYMMQLQA